MRGVGGRVGGDGRGGGGVREQLRTAHYPELNEVFIDYVT